MRTYVVFLKGVKYPFSVLKGKVKNSCPFLRKFDGKPVEKMFEFLEENYEDYSIKEVK